MGRKSFVPVLQCRFCGSIFTSEAGAKSHGTECRHVPVLNGAMKISPMVAVKFPCPLIYLEKIAPQRGVIARFMWDNKLPQRKSSLKALQKLQMVVKSESETLPKDKELDLDSKSKRLIKNKKSAKEDEWVVPTWDKGNIKLLKKPYYRIQGRTPRLVNGSNETCSCKYCGLTVRRNYLRRHVKLKHTDGKIHIVKEKEKPFPCPFPECTAKLKQFEFLKTHFLYHLENNPFRCTFPNCSFRSDARCHLVRHMRMHIGQLGPCPKCDKRIPWVGQMQRHADCKNNDSNEKVFTNEDFDVEIKKLNTEPKYLTSIIRKLIGSVNINSIFVSDPVFIRICEKNPEFKKQILQHGSKERGRGRTKSMPEEKKLKCEKCPKTFESERVFRAHITEMHLPRPHKCPTCLRTYRAKGQLNGHIRNVHNNKLLNNKFMIQLEAGRCKCTKCGAERSCITSLKRHWLLIHKIQLPNFRDREEKNKNRKRKRTRIKRHSPFRKILAKPTVENFKFNVVIKVEAGLEANETKPVVLSVQNSLVKTDLEECSTPVQAVDVKRERLETSGIDIGDHGENDNIISVKFEPQDDQFIT